MMMLSRLVSRRSRVVVLCYHSVHPDAGSPTRTPPDVFEQHMYWLRERCDLISFAQLREEGDPSDGARPAVAVTFDDGFADNYVHALPILRRLGIPATFFVSTGLVERSSDAIQERSWHGWRDPGSTLTWKQILEIRAAGMDIGAHGHSHRSLGKLTDDEVVADLSTCKRIMEDRLGESVMALAYPHGRPRRDFSSRTKRLAKDVGYRLGAAIHLRGVKPSDDPMSIPRFPIADDSLDTLRKKVTGAFDLIGLWQERAPMWLLSSIESSRRPHLRGTPRA